MLTHKGKIVSIGKAENISKNPDRKWLKRSFVLDDAGDGAKYPNPVQFELNQEDCSLVDRFVVGQEVTVSFFLNGRSWMDKRTGMTRFFTSLRVKSIEGASLPTNLIPEPEPPAQAEQEDFPF